MQYYHEYLMNHMTHCYKTFLTLLPDILGNSFHFEVGRKQLLSAKLHKTTGHLKISLCTLTGKNWRQKLRWRICHVARSRKGCFSPVNNIYSYWSYVRRNLKFEKSLETLLTNQIPKFYQNSFVNVQIKADLCFWRAFLNLFTWPF